MNVEQTSYSMQNWDLQLGLLASLSCYHQEKTFYQVQCI